MSNSITVNIGHKRINTRENLTSKAVGLRFCNNFERVGILKKVFLTTNNEAYVRDPYTEANDVRDPSLDVKNNPSTVVTLTMSGGSTITATPTIEDGMLSLSIPEDCTEIYIYTEGSLRSSVSARGIYYDPSIIIEKVVFETIVEGMNSIRYIERGDSSTHDRIIVGPVILDNGSYYFAPLSSVIFSRYYYDQFKLNDNPVSYAFEEIPEKGFITLESIDGLSSSKVYIASQYGEGDDSYGMFFATAIEPKREEVTVSSHVSPINTRASRSGYKEPSEIIVKSHVKKIVSHADYGAISLSQDVKSTVRKISSNASLSKQAIRVVTSRTRKIVSTSSIASTTDRVVVSKVRRIINTVTVRGVIGLSALDMLKEQLGIPVTNTDRDHELQLLLDEAYQFIHEACYQIHDPMPLAGIIIAVKYALHSYYGDNYELDPEFHGLTKTYSSKRAKRRILKRELYLAGLVLLNRIIGDSMKDVIVDW